MASDPPISRTGLFAPEAEKVWTIPPGADFLGSLARTLALEHDLKNNPAALSDALIYVPNRRSARALTLALYKEAGGKPILPPDIRALGDLELDEPPIGAEEALTNLGPPLSSARRLGTLARLVSKFYAENGTPLPPVSALAAARELGRLLDSAALSGEVDWASLPDLVDDTDLAVHWEKAVKFLEIITRIWPDWLRENGATEAYERRLIVAQTIAETLLTTPPQSPVIIAGSTAATPATRALMEAVASLPKGVIVLPGLDRDAPAQMWEQIRARPDKQISGEPDHPQFSLATTLYTLGLNAEHVPVWPGILSDDTAHARQRLVYESLAPAQQTADWLKRLETLSAPASPVEFATHALTGLSLLEADDEAHEALLAALMMREALETPGQTTALVTPDATLARQVSALLKRWQISVAPSGGIPLGRTSSGSFMLLALKWAEDTGDPVALAALLKHEKLRADPQAVSLLETSYLRGPRRWDDLGSLLESLPRRTEDAAANRHTQLHSHALTTSTNLLTPLHASAEMAAQFAQPDLNITGQQAADLLIKLINKLAGDETSSWRGREGEACSKCLEAASELTAQMPTLTVSAFTDIFRALAANATVVEDVSAHPRLNIWGPLEARLQHADRLILAGLNEDVWPVRPPADAFLPRRFRAPLGLQAPEARLGLAAHDFAQLAAAPDVTLLYSARRSDAPAVASRWVLRLQTLCEGALGAADAKTALAPAASRDPRPWARALTADAQTSSPRLSQPRPTPPVSARPKHLSVTRIDTLQRDPYAIYAGNILRLRKLDPLNGDFEARQRGTAIHKALEDFESASPEQQTVEHLHAALLSELAAAGEAAHTTLANRAPMRTVAQKYVTWWKTRQNGLKQVWPEVRRDIKLTISGAPFWLTGVGDRLELREDGTYAIIDFKTGDGKTRKQIDSGFEQQLPLLALIAREGDMQIEAAPSLLNAPVSEFGYVSVRYRFSADPITRDIGDAQALTDAARETLIKLIGEFRRADVPYLSIPRVAVKSKYAGDFDRLARRAEWASDIQEGGDG